MNYKIRLKELRLEKQLTQQEIAGIFKMARQTYNHYEVQENIIPIKHINKIVNFYNVSVDYLLGLTDKRKYPGANKDINIKSSSERLKNFRKSKNITQQQLAQTLNTFHTVIVDYEKGKNLIAIPFLYTICKTYKISADYLLGRIDKPKYLE